jgi:hypothetical protein
MRKLKPREHHVLPVALMQNLGTMPLPSPRACREIMHGTSIKISPSSC